MSADVYLEKVSSYERQIVCETQYEGETIIDCPNCNNEITVKTEIWKYPKEVKNDFQIKEINYLGDFVEILLSKDKKEILVKTSADILNKDDFKEGNKVGIIIKEEEITYFES